MSSRRRAANTVIIGLWREGKGEALPSMTTPECSAGALNPDSVGNAANDGRPIHYSALATDYDGTIATHGAVDEATRAALRRFRASGRKLILVTGRRIADLAGVYPYLGDFDAIVAENGALLYWPEDQREEPLAAPPPAEFIQFLMKADVRPIESGRVIVATVEPHQHIVLEAIRTFGLELQVIFNKGAVMILPSGINKATGLEQALKAMGIPPKEVVGVGDAENDHALLDFCGYSAAVANALPALKERADFVLAKSHGEGVAELIDCILGRASDGTL
jgi:hydroxymethylpyrimidine pyrophosphatase-like HAD family hydrolase